MITLLETRELTRMENFIFKAKRERDMFYKAVVENQTQGSVKKFSEDLLEYYDKMVEQFQEIIDSSQA